MDLNQFLSELETGDGERSHFAVDWKRAQEQMGTHLGMESKEFACHFAQLAYLLGSSYLQLSASGEWLEWSCDGAALDPSKMQATAAGELVLADLDLCLNFCLQCVALTPYVEKIFSSGGLQLRYLAPHWQLRPTKTSGTRLQLRLPLQNRLRNFFRSASWWQALPELKSLGPRLSASPLEFKSPSQLDRPESPLALGILGSSPISTQPPVRSAQVIRCEDRSLSGSLWLVFEGQECHILSQGLSYASQPFLPGKMWLSVGDLPLDLGRRELVLNPGFYTARSALMIGLSRHFADWLKNRELQQAGVQTWLLRCLVLFAGREGGEFEQTLSALPLIPALGRPSISLLQLDQEVAARGCYTLEEDWADPPTEEAPLIVVSRDVSFTAFLRNRYKTLHSGAELLRRMREHQGRDGELMDLQELNLYPHSTPLVLEGWRGGMAFDPEETKARLQCYRHGKLLLDLTPTQGMVGGFWMKVDHPELEADADWRAPFGNEAWKGFLEWAQHGQSAFLCQIMEHLPRPQRRNLMWRVLGTQGIRMGPLLQVPLWKDLTLENWLVDGQKGDLRRWVEAQAELSDPLVSMLTQKFGRACAEEALRQAARYTVALANWRARPQESLELPIATLAQASTDFPLRVGLVEEPGTSLRLFREGRFLVEHSLAKMVGFPRGLAVAADHPEFRLDPSGGGLDPKCLGYQQLLEAIGPALTLLMEHMLQESAPSIRHLALDTLESLSFKHWPSHAELFRRLDGLPVSLELAQTGPLVRVLVAPAARVVLPGFEDCWCLGSKELAWARRVLRRDCRDVTKDYNEAYRVSCYEKGISGQAEELPDWSLPQSFACGSLRAVAGLVRESGPVHACQTSFCRGGQTVMRCLLLLGPNAGPVLDQKLFCRVDWEDIPFVQNYSQLRALPEVRALVDWLRRYSFQPVLDHLPYQLARLRLEITKEPLSGWGQSQDPVLRELVACPFLPTHRGPAKCLQALLDCELDVIYAPPQEKGAAGLCLDAGLLQQMQQLIPGLRWRHASEPAADQAFKRALRICSPRGLQMPQLPMMLEGRGQHWVWRVPWSPSGASQITVLYQGRQAGKIAPKWDLEVVGEIMVEDVHLTSEAQIRLVGELRTKLDGLWQEVQQRVLADLKRPDRLRLILGWLNRGSLPTWASNLEERDRLQQWWARWDAPRPFLSGEGWRGEFPCWGPELAGWARLEGMSLYDCTEFAERLARAQVCQRPDCEFEVEGPGYYLSAHRSLQQTVEREVCGGRLLDEQVHTAFPPYYLERHRSDWRECGPLPPQAWTSLLAWWSGQLEQPPERLGWLSAIESLLEQSGPGAEHLTEKAKLQLLRLQQRDRADGWELLRRGLELLCLESVVLQIGHQGPLVECDGVRLHLNERLAGEPTRARTAELLCLASLELPTRRTVVQVLSMLQNTD